MVAADLSLRMTVILLYAIYEHIREPQPLCYLLPVFFVVITKYVWETKEHNQQANVVEH